jgi:hypothetical protein
MTTPKRSPLKDAPLRNPGQSLDEQIQDIWDSIFNYLLHSIGFIALTIAAWISWITQQPLKPYLPTILTLGICLLAAYQFNKKYRQIKRLQMARDGEKAVGQYLDLLRKDGAQVFHDILGQGFNLDHVLISPHGIYTVETKTYSKPAKGQAVITIQNDRLLANGMPIDRDPLTQARAEARWLQDLLQSSTGKKFPVKPVIVFPGWFVEPMKSGAEIWILNPKALPAFLANAPAALPPDDVYLASYHLSRYIRSTAGNHKLAA